MLFHCHWCSVLSCSFAIADDLSDRRIVEAGPLESVPLMIPTAVHSPDAGSAKRPRAAAEDSFRTHLRKNLDLIRKVSPYTDERFTIWGVKVNEHDIYGMERDHAWGLAVIQFDRAIIYVEDTAHLHKWSPSVIEALIHAVYANHDRSFLAVQLLGRLPKDKMTPSVINTLIFAANRPVRENKKAEDTTIEAARGALARARTLGIYPFRKKPLPAESRN